MGILLPIVRGGRGITVPVAAAAAAAAPDPYGLSNRLRTGLDGPMSPGFCSVQSDGRGLRLKSFQRRLRNHHVDQVFDLGQFVALVRAPRT